ncbi:MAG: hypothetical protein KF884_08695 [Fimbriimonadaceae bacterium]|nr:hypothetical protein [Fimbriimonadaceae bacterium]QYK57627.1 MAG: hypothetical protein KF884_08695 [Fimbriimonadaceae bacterium]
MNHFYRLITMAAWTAAATAAFAATQVIEGQGVAENPQGGRAEFAMNVRKIDPNRPTGTFTASWNAGDARITVALASSPSILQVRERVGRFSGPAIKRVRTAQGVTETRGWVYVNCVDLNDPRNPGNRKDEFSVRFVRDLWGSPDGDVFFAGSVVRGDIAVLFRS